MNDKEFLSQLFDELYPIMRSITGPGIEKSIDIFKKHMPLKITKVPSGTKVFDWVVPQEWHFKKAKLIDPEGDIICDASLNNLHIVNYSIAINKKLSLEELQHHLYTIPELPDAIPYVTSYYKKGWGFCITEKQKLKLKKGVYHAIIESKFVDGGVPLAECRLQGESEKEILLTSYLCHPSMANNELSGPLGLLSLYKRISNWKKRRYSYRFLLNPETIGALCFLHKNGAALQENLVSGLVLTCIGGPSNTLRFKSSRKQDSLINKVCNYSDMNTPLSINPVAYNPTDGSDERQYCSPGFNLPIGQISRTTYGLYKEYHTSLDDKEYMNIDNVIESIDTIEKVLQYIEIAGYPINLFPYGEPQLGKRNLYPNINSNETRKNSTDNLIDSREQLDRMLYLLNLADGEHDLIEISKIIGCSLDELKPIILMLEEKKMITYNKDF